jgi:predicted dehydrogenase
MSSVSPRARIGVCGAGWWSQGWHLPQLARNPHAEIAAIVEVNPTPRSAISHLESVAALGERYKVRTFGSMDALLESDTHLDGLVICTSHASHFELGCKALANGWHVLMEKPMTTDCGEARQLEALARKSGLAFMVNNTANWRAQAKAATEWVADGSIGKVEHVSCVMHSPLLWLFDDPANTGWTQPSGTMVGNGFGYGQLSHLLAWVVRVARIKPQSAFCAMGRSERSGADMTDAAVICCEGGASVSVSGAGSVPGDAHSAHSVGKFISVRIFGSEGMITYEGDDQKPQSGQLELRRRNGETRALEGFQFENYEADGDGPESLQAFISACRRQKDVFVGADAEVGLQVVLALDAMYRSAKSGCREDVCPEDE